MKQIILLTLYTIAIIITTGYVYNVNQEEFSINFGPGVISANATGTTTMFMSCSKGMGVKYHMPF